MRKVIYSVITLLVIALVLYLILVNRNNQNQVANNQTLRQPTPIESNATGAATLKPNFEIDKNKKYTVTLKTTEGDIIIELNVKDKPKTSANFVNLSKANFYNNTIFHRVISGFMIQGGDPKGNGTGGPGYKFDDEPFEGEYTRGTVAMANSGPNTNGSQFFIMHKDYPLPKNYVIFGKVIKDIEVVDKIAEAPVTFSPTGEKSKPLNPVTVKEVEIKED